MIKRIAIVVLIVSVLAGFSISAIRIIMRGSVRSQKTQEEINMSEIIENATVMGTYSSDVKIRAGESIGAKDLLDSALSNPVSVGSDLPYVNLSKCNIYFESGKTKEQILSPGKKKFTIIASFEDANRDYLYYVELEADEAPATTVTKAASVTTSHPHHTTAPEKYYNDAPKKTVQSTKPATKKPVVVVTTVANTHNSLPVTEITQQNPVTEPPQDENPPEDVPSTPSVPDNPPEPVDPPSDPQPTDPPSDPQPEAPADAQQ